MFCIFELNMLQKRVIVPVFLHQIVHSVLESFLVQGVVSEIVIPEKGHPQKLSVPKKAGAAAQIAPGPIGVRDAHIHMVIRLVHKGKQGAQVGQENKAFRFLQIRRNKDRGLH